VEQYTATEKMEDNESVVFFGAKEMENNSEEVCEV
jgi:hypothetical protein